MTYNFSKNNLASYDQLTGINTSVHVQNTSRAPSLKNNFSTKNFSFVSSPSFIPADIIPMASNPKRARTSEENNGHEETPESSSSDDGMCTYEN